jgi:sigma-B regulation protein RsbU (phosphoserine phosphatase)
MKVLIAEDDLVPRRILQAVLQEWGYEVIVTCDGEAAWQVLQTPDAPKLVILDWMMPGLDGVEVCRRVREIVSSEPIYVILLTGREAKQDVVAGLSSGANDYVTKPFDREELQARVQVGARVVELQRSLAARVRELEDALTEVKQLRGLLPICSYCKKVRDDQNYWEQVDKYIIRHTEVRFSHGICPDCWKTQVEPQLRQLGIEQEWPGSPGAK